jgi:DNA-binding MarR family transcriptional regulator
MTAAAAPPPVMAGKSPACTCFKLRSLARRVTQLYDHEMAPSGLKVTQYSLIAHALRGAGGAAPTVSELAQAMFTDRTTLTRNLRPLVDAGLLEVAPGADARSKAVRVTRAGEAAYRAARPLWRAAQARMRSLGGETQVDGLHDLVDMLLPRLDAPAATDAAVPHS